jgi:ubiquitin-conjugating enzyme E2 R
MAQKRLFSEFQSLRREKWVHIDVNDINVFNWGVGLMVVNPDSVFNGAYLKVFLPLSMFFSHPPFLPATVSETLLTAGNRLA